MGARVPDWLKDELRGLSSTVAVATDDPLRALYQVCELLDAESESPSSERVHVIRKLHRLAGVLGHLADADAIAVAVSSLRTSSDASGPLGAPGTSNQESGMRVSTRAGSLASGASGKFPDLANDELVVWCGNDDDSTRTVMSEAIRRRGSSIIGPVEVPLGTPLATASLRRQSRDTGMQVHVLVLGQCSKEAVGGYSVGVDSIVSVTDHGGDGVRWKLTRGTSASYGDVVLKTQM